MSSLTVPFLDLLGNKQGLALFQSGQLDNRYLRLDTTNKPLTGGLTIEPDTDTLTALVVNDKDSNNVLTVDTINNRTFFNGIVDTDAIVLKDGSTKKASLFGELIQ